MALGVASLLNAIAIYFLLALPAEVFAGSADSRCCFHITIPLKSYPNFMILFIGKIDIKGFIEGAICLQLHEAPERVL